MLRVAGALIALSTSVGCAAERGAFVPPPVAPHSSGAFSQATLDVLFANNLGWPYRLESLLVVLDGAVIYRKTYREAEAEGETVPIARLSGLPSGDHTLQLMATVRYPTGSLDDACVLTLRTAKTFSLSNQRAWVHLDAHAGDVTLGFAERVLVSVRTQDSPPAAEVSQPPSFDWAADVCN